MNTAYIVDAVRTALAGVEGLAPPSEPITQGGVGTAQARIVATDATANTVTLSSVPAPPFTAGALVNALTSSNYFVHAGHQRNHSLVVLPQVGGQLGVPSAVIPTSSLGCTKPPSLVRVSDVSGVTSPYCTITHRPTSEVSKKPLGTLSG